MPSIETRSISGTYKWTPSAVYEVNTEAELLERLDEAQSQGRSIRVMGSAWSANQFLNPNTALIPDPSFDPAVGALVAVAAPPADSESTGINIVLRGEFTRVPYHFQYEEHSGPEECVTIGAGSQRQPIYAFLAAMDNGEGREMMATGECFLTCESQTLGGLVANAVHDTMEVAFTPETVAHIRAAVFENGKAVIKDFSDKDGDAFYSFFGGFGLTGVIVAASPLIRRRTFYHRLSYYHGTEYLEDYAVGQPPPLLGDDAYPIKFHDALLDLQAKAMAADKSAGDIASCFVLFSNEKGVDGCGKTLVDRPLSRYYSRARGGKPANFAYIKQDVFNDYCALLAREYCSAKDTIDVLSPIAISVEDAVHELKYKSVNLKNYSRAGYPHEAYYESNAAHTTGPHYIYLWEKAVEFYVVPEHVVAFCAILEERLREQFLDPARSVVGTPMHGASDAFVNSNEPIAGVRTAPSIFADCRFACGSDKAFMTGFYKSDAFAIDIGSTKHHRTNEQFTVFVSSILRDCMAKNIPVRLHTGKFYVYERDIVKHIYNDEARRRLSAVTSAHDPNGVFAPKWMRELFAY